MSNVKFRNDKNKLSSSVTLYKDRTNDLLCAESYNGFSNQTLILTAILSFIIFAGAVSNAVSTYSSHEALRGNLCPQVGQYLCVMFSGMFMGTTVGTWFEKASYSIWRLVTYSGINSSFRRYQLRVSLYILLIGLPVNLLFLLRGLNQFIDLNPGLKTEIILLMYTMGLLTGGAWFLMFHNKAGWGLLISFTMSLMVMGNILSIHSWP